MRPPAPELFELFRSVALVLVAATLVQVIVLLILGRVRRPAPSVAGTIDNLPVMVVIPCLNEGRVIAATVANLLDQGRSDLSVMVIDDGSDDDTAEQLMPFLGDTRFELFQRRLPQARQGKGHALNAAYQELRSRPWAGDELIVCVLDADGRLHPGAIDDALALFADPEVGAVQIAVRIRNAGTNLLARLQDVEFLVYTEVYQRGRNRLESVGLGGNGQFVRLRALEDLGDEPWSECLTEDLDLGVRLLLAGHRNRYCPSAVVDQQGLVSLRRFVRQRTRWFQGHLECWSLLGRVGRSSLPRRARADLSLQLTSTMQLLVASVVITATWGLGLVDAAVSVAHPAEILLGPTGMLTYLIAFSPSPFIAWIYWRHHPEIGFVRGLLLAHCFVLYTCLWFIAGWRAVVRALRRQRSWAKTARVIELPAVSVPLAVAVPVAVPVSGSASAPTTISVPRYAANSVPDER